MCHSHWIKPLISALNYYNSLFCGLPVSKLLHFSLFSIQPFPVFKMKIRSCHSFAQTSQKPPISLRVKARGLIMLYQPQIIWCLIPCLPLSHTFLSLLTPFSHPDLLAILKQSNSYLRAFAFAYNPHLTCKALPQWLSDSSSSNVYSTHTSRRFFSDHHI